MRGFMERKWPTILARAARGALDDGATDVAAALAYYAFLAVPAVGLVTLGLFTVLAGEDTVNSLVDRLDGVVPDEATALLQDSLTRALDNTGRRDRADRRRRRARGLDCDERHGRAHPRAEPDPRAHREPLVRPPPPARAPHARLGASGARALAGAARARAGHVRMARRRARRRERRQLDLVDRPVADPHRRAVRDLRRGALPRSEHRAAAASSRDSRARWSRS